MPPLRTGLLKRKIKSQEEDTSSVSKVTDEEQKSDTDESSDIPEGVVDDDDDVTDSEGEHEAVNSDQEVEEVLYENDADSTLGNESDIEKSSDESSELTDSEESDDDEDSVKQDSNEDDSNSEAAASADSGTESGTARLHSASSDEAEKLSSKNTKSSKKLTKLKQNFNKKEQDSVQKLANVIKEDSIKTLPVVKKDEYESGDTSDEEGGAVAAVGGGVPRWWYREYTHVGYDTDGRRVLRPPHADHIDRFLRQCEDPDFWRTVRDPTTGQDIILSKEDLQLIASIREGRVPNPEHDEYEPWVEWFSREVLATPLRAFPDHKRSFLPSRTEQQQISRIVHALKMGWTKTRKQLALERKKKKERRYYDLWVAAGEAEGAERGGARHIPAPRRPPPSHAESYNPPPEYLLDKQEMKEWRALEATPWKRKLPFLPARHGSLRAVPGYARFVRERFLRCLDLYLAPRAVKLRLTVTPEQLVPRLPAPRELQPFPTQLALEMRGHDAPVRSLSFDPSGQFLATGADDGTVKLWEVSTGRCVNTVSLGESVVSVAWSGARGVFLLAAAAGDRLLLINPAPRLAQHRAAQTTDELLERAPPQHDRDMDERTRAAVRWEEVSAAEWAAGVRCAVRCGAALAGASWHARGDYVCSVSRAEGARAVLVHQVSRRRSQMPLRRTRGLVQCAAFCPRRPRLFVATQRAVRIYDLVAQQLVRKLTTGAQWISAIAPHPAGDNLLVASYDRKLVWFDLELSPHPYQTLRLHGGAVRAVAFHPRYPLFASAGDDARIVVSHGMVYQDLLQNPLLVPLKALPAGAPCDDLCVLGLSFHPHQPWLAAACADHTVRLYS